MMGKTTLKGQCVSGISVFLILTLSKYVVGGNAPELDSEKSKDFNEIKFTQLWGYSSCLQFKEAGQAEEKCRYEDQPSIFSIHGIWPTETGTPGPNFCEKVKFDENLIESIESQLNLYWYEISPTKNPKQFWTHEWVKHGSCAQVLPTFSSQLKYFEGGLDLRTKYDLYTVFKAGGIIPETNGKGYLTTDFIDAFRKVLGVNPYVQCLHTKDGDIHLLAVEICLDRNLIPIDCSTHDTRHLDLDSVLPCPPNHQILYQDIIPHPKQEL